MAAVACSTNGRGGDNLDEPEDTDTGTSSDTDIDTDADADSDTQTDSATDTESETGFDTDSGSDLEWVELEGGTFGMGDNGPTTSEPPHSVDVPSFELMKTEVTVAQYAKCVEESQCSAPGVSSDWCNWDVQGRLKHPVNCVARLQAAEFCEWSLGRLPSEAEWEYAACSAGTDDQYPWGWADGSCDRAVIWDYSGLGCGAGGTWPVCGKQAGNSAQGICDLGGNVFEWVQDWYHPNYQGAPADGSAWEIPMGTDRVIRGGSFDVPASYLIHYVRFYYDPAASDAYHVGFRCAR